MKNENLEKKLNPDSKPEKGEKLKRIIYDKSMNFIEKRFNELVVEGKENIPKDDYVIFVGNHAKLIDPLVFYYLVGNIPMIARDDSIDDLPLNGFPFKLKIFGKGWDLNPLLNKFLSWEFDSVPIRRKGIKPSQTKKCIKKFEENKKICSFPMGTRTTSGSIHDMYEGSDKRNPGKLVDILQRSIDKPAKIVPFSLSYDEIIMLGALTIGKPFTIDTNNIKKLPPNEKEKFYDDISEDIMSRIGNLTKVYGDSILATIVKSATSNLKEKKYRYYINKYSLMEVFNSVVGGLDKYNKGIESNSNKKINLYDKLLDNEYRKNYLNQFFCWAENKMQLVGISLSKGYLLYLDNIKKEPRKRMFLKKDVNITYLYNKSKHIIPLQEIVSEEIKNKENLIFSESIH
ncbi:MAG: 1-acyl-sn-glycerol-3-phosphate acyltransferase [Nanoarchaeota archaeon]|nr:1-acyl-sn-glycerol-3-phosphate acyltransferase [Nanoarchaeota archaeon]MBU4493484.1 1-acyl-sn-glycerol-3-phosphate acyltransferase [Nanoarchaeota archaeon]